MVKYNNKNLVVITFLIKRVGIVDAHAPWLIPSSDHIYLHNISTSAMVPNFLGLQLSGHVYGIVLPHARR